MPNLENAKNKDTKISKLKISEVYPLYLQKIAKKNRTEEELLIIIEWLTGYDSQKIQKFISKQASFEDFFKNAVINPNAHLIKGSICGGKVEEISHPLTQKIRYLDKLVDELYKGKPLDKILRKSVS